MQPRTRAHTFMAPSSQVTSPSSHSTRCCFLAQSSIILPFLITGAFSQPTACLYLLQSHISATIFVYFWGIFLGAQAKKIIPREKVEFLSSQFISLPSLKVFVSKVIDSEDTQSLQVPSFHSGRDFNLSLPQRQSHIPESCSPKRLNFFLTFSELQEQGQISIKKFLSVCGFTLPNAEHSTSRLSFVKQVQFLSEIFYHLNVLGFCLLGSKQLE